MLYSAILCTYIFTTILLNLHNTFESSFFYFTIRLPHKKIEPTNKHNTTNFGNLNVKILIKKKCNNICAIS